MTAGTQYTHTIRAHDLRNAEKVLNSPSRAKSNGELYDALRTLVGFAMPIQKEDEE